MTVDQDWSRPERAVNFADLTNYGRDLANKLWLARKRAGLTQREAALRSGVHDKSISSWETGERIGSLTVTQLQSLLGAYGVSESEFFA